MATYPQRAQAIGDAYINGVATPGQLSRLGRAIAWHVGLLAEYDAMTNAKKAEFFVERQRLAAIDMVKRFDQATGNASVAASVGPAVDAEFQPAP